MGRPLFRTSSHDPALCPCANCVRVRSATSSTSALASPSTTTLSPPVNSGNITTPHARSHLNALLANIADSQASLLRASAVVEAAYNRLRSIRASIEHRMPPPTSPTTTPPTSAPRDAMGPDHHAIVFEPNPEAPPRAHDPMSLINELRSSSSAWHSVASAWPGDPSDDSRDPFYDGYDLWQAIDDVREARRRMEPLMNPSEPVSPSHTPRPPTANSLRFGPRPEPSQAQSRRSFLESYVRSHREGASDSSTSLGRRVAARASAGTRGSDAAESREDQALRIMEIAASLQRDIVLLAERREEAMQARTSNPSPTVPPTASTAVSAENAPERAGAGGSRGTERRAATTTPQSTWFSRFSRDVSDRSHVTITSTRRLPGPELPAHAPRQGNDDMQPPAPPSSAPPAPGQPRVLDEAAVNADAANNHSYRITRRFNPDGEEHVHNIVMDESDSDDPFSWMVPRGDRRRGERSISDRREPTPTTPATSYGELMRQRRERTAQIRAQAAPRTDSSPAQASSTRRRRRGWARLDQDGNEIPTDEEEEYERNLAQVRSRALALSAGTAPQRLERPQQQLPPPPPPNQRLSFVPTTQSMLWQAPADVRVRLNPPSPPSGSNGDMSTPRAGRAEAAAGERSDVDVPEAFGSAAPFKPSPLALPLVDLSPQRLSKRHRGAESALVGNPSAKAFAAGR